MTALDPQRIREAAGDDPEFIQELMDLYLEDAAERIEQLRAAVAAGAEGDLARYAHQLKGSSANVGAMGIAHSAKSLEEKGKTGDLDGASELVDAAERDLKLIGPEVRQLLESL